MLRSDLAAAKLNPSYADFAQNIVLNVPIEAATATLKAVPDSAPTESVNLSRTFIDFFDTFDITSNKYSPHMDGGVGTPTMADWPQHYNRDKRYQKASSEQQIYVDPRYWGDRTVSKGPLGLSPFKHDPLGKFLTIEASKTPESCKDKLYGHNYISGLISTRRSHLQLHGFFEAQIRMPFKQGLLPAFWMLQAEPRTWPPEIDVMEQPSHKGSVIQHSLHYKNDEGKAQSTGVVTDFPNLDNTWHRYGVLWTPERIVYFIDRVPVAQRLTPASLTQPMYMQVNLAVGGTWIGNVADENATIPSHMDISTLIAYSVRAVNEPLSCTKDPVTGVTTCL